MRLAYSNHQQRAKRAGIGFHFTFQEWVGWWRRRLGDDWMKKRGRKRGQYAMARIGDVGPYAEGNVKCITADQNSSEVRHRTGEDHCWAKLTAAQVAEARALYKGYSSELGVCGLARRYGIGHAAMRKALSGDTWKTVSTPSAGMVGIKRKLTWDTVGEARRIYVPNDPERGAGALSRKYGVCVQTMWEALTGKTWRDPPQIGV